MATAAPSFFHAMAKRIGARRNLACDYCFFLKKERLYPESRSRMPGEVVESQPWEYLLPKTVNF